MTDPGAPPRDRSRFYDTIAAEFDVIMNPYDLARRLEAVAGILERAGLASGSRALDLGCGTGPFTLLTQAHGFEVVAVDIGPKLLGVARRKGARLPVAADALRLPFRDGAFDAVVTSECIEHTVAPRSAVAEALRVIRPGGILALTCPNRAWHWAVTVASALRMRPYEGYENWPGWTELRGWVNESGGEVLTHTGLHALPFQFPGARSMLPVLDRMGSGLEHWFVNQVVEARRR
ncbi:MAG TPA: methyltransferase domain-containing protein [Gemmatimonadales bacterium]|nr:methyltransferase domain-containing protein [Gemmatimonadales bacterium]